MGAMAQTINNPWLLFQASMIDAFSAQETCLE
jgi:hypothetical protein